MHAGAWYQCQQGHIYTIGDCGGAMEESNCPECGSVIGGLQHRIHESNSSAVEFTKGAPTPFTEADNLQN